MSQIAERPHFSTPRDRNKRLTGAFPSSHSTSLERDLESQSAHSYSSRSLNSAYRASDLSRHPSRSPAAPPLPRIHANRRAAIIIPSSRIDPPSPPRPSEPPSARSPRGWREKAVDPVSNVRTLDSELALKCSASSLRQEHRPLPAQIRKSHRYRTTFDIGFTGIVTDDQKASFEDVPPSCARLSFLPSFGDSDSDRPPSPSGWCDSSDTNADVPISTPLSLDSSDTSSFSLDPDVSLGFPQPPSTNPASLNDEPFVLCDPDSGAPLVTRQETGAVREFLRERWVARIKAQEEKRRLATRIVSPQNFLTGREGQLRQKDIQENDYFSWEAEAPPAEDDMIAHKGRRIPSNSRVDGDLNHMSPTVSSSLASERLQETSIVAHQHEDDVSMVLRPLRALDDGEGLQALSIGEDCGSALAESMLEWNLSINAPAQVPDRFDPLVDRHQREGRRGQLNPRSFTLPAHDVLAPPRPCAAPSLLPSVSITSTKTAPHLCMPKIIRKVTSMRLRGTEREGSIKGTKARQIVPPAAVSTKHAVQTSPRRSSALVRLDASIAKLRAQHSPLGSAPAHPQQLHRAKSPSLGCVKLAHRDRKERTSFENARTTHLLGSQSGSSQRAEPMRLHHLKSRSLACLSKEDGCSEPARPNGVRVNKPRLSPRHPSRAPAELSMHRSRSFGSLVPDRSPVISGDALGPPFVHRHTMGQTGKLVKLSRQGHMVSAEGQHVKSFMDVTPEQEKKSGSSGLGSQKERMRRFIARASGGVMGWGKFLTRKA